MAHTTRAVPLPAKPAPPISTTRPCASCGQPLARSGRWHRDTGTVSCRPVIDPDDGGWAEPDRFETGSVATDPATVAHQLGALAARYLGEAETPSPRAVTRRHAADGLRTMALYLVSIDAGSDGLR